MKDIQPNNLSSKEWYRKGQRLTRQGCHKEAIEAINRAIQKNPVYGEAYFVRAACNYALGKFRQAGNDLDAAALFGCQDAQLWSKYPIGKADKNVDNEET